MIVIEARADTSWNLKFLLAVVLKNGSAVWQGIVVVLGS